MASVSATLGLLSGLLLMAEHGASPRLAPRTAAAVISPAQITPTAPAPVAVAQPLPSGLTEAQAMAFAQQFSLSSIAAAGAGVIFCADLLAQRAATVSTYAALIAAFPDQTAAFIVFRTAALKVIDSQLLAFGCPVPSGT